MRVTTAEDLSRMMGRFRGNIDFSDSPNGFFGFVRETFEQLAREEAHAADYEGVRIPDYPSFGHKDDAYDDVVKNFYAIWNGFATAKSFAWKDVYRTQDAPDRRVRRLMEKENRKFREEGIRQFNDAVRTLVAFVRKRDPRFTPSKQTAEEAAKAQREARKAQAARSRAAHAAKINDQTSAVPTWATVRDPDEVDEESEEEIEEEHFECVACRKTFKSERQYDAHEKSKKHQKAVQALKRKMQNENAWLNLGEDATSSGLDTPASGEGLAEDATDEADDSVNGLTTGVQEVKVEGGSTDNEPEVLSHDSEEEAATHQKPQERADAASTEDDSEDDDDEYASRSDIEARLASYRKPADAPDIDNDDAPAPAPADTESTAPAGKKLGKAAQKRAKKAAKQAEQDQPDAKFRCVKCNAGFPSKTQLFDHLKANPKHAAPVSAMKGAAGGAKKGKRK